MADLRILHNPRCSKSRGCLSLLDQQGIDHEVVRYLENTPDQAELEWLYTRLGPAMVRTGEPIYKELKLAQADRATLLEALRAHPILIERPIVVRGDRAIVARPPERVLEFLQEGDPA